MTRELISMCPHCGYHHDRITGVTKKGAKREPKVTAGSCTLCANCGRWCIVDKYMRLRKPTAGDMRRIEQSEVAMKTRLGWLLSRAAPEGKLS